MKPSGPCHICGIHGPLTFEHIPPASAFNGEKVMQADVRQLLEGRSIDNVRRRQQQAGMGRRVLCGSCNNNTGAWYSSAYAAFAYQAVRYLTREPQAVATLALPYNIYPLRILKQVGAMMLALNGPRFQAAHRELVKFVLNAEERHWPRSAGTPYMAYVTGSTARHSGVTGLMNMEDSSQNRTFSEMSFRPFSFLLNHGGPIGRTELLDITSFGVRSLNEWTTLHFRAPLLELPDSALPGMFLDKRTGQPFSF